MGETGRVFQVAEGRQAVARADDIRGDVVGGLRRSRPGEAGGDQQEKRIAPGGHADLSGVPSMRKRRLAFRSEEHTSELQSLMRISYAVFCLKKKKKNHIYKQTNITTKHRTPK